MLPGYLTPRVHTSNNQRWSGSRPLLRTLVLTASKCLVTGLQFSPGAGQSSFSPQLPSVVVSDPIRQLLEYSNAQLSRTALCDIAEISPIAVSVDGKVIFSPFLTYQAAYSDISATRTSHPTGRKIWFVYSPRQNYRCISTSRWDLLNMIEDGHLSAKTASTKHRYGIINRVLLFALLIPSDRAFTSNTKNGYNEHMQFVSTALNLVPPESLFPIE